MRICPETTCTVPSPWFALGLAVAVWGALFLIVFAVLWVAGVPV